MKIGSFFHPALMKQSIFMLLFLGTALFLQAQKAKPELYGYRQRITGGAKKVGEIDETGKLIKKKTRDVFHYAIYVATASKARIYPVQLWINGEAFSVEMERVMQTPVTQEAVNLLNGNAKILVPEAAGSVYKLNTVPLISDKGDNRAYTLAKTHAVLFLYKTAGKLQYGVLKKFTDLEPVSMP